MPSCVSQVLWSLWRCAFLTPNPDKAAFCLGGLYPKPKGLLLLQPRPPWNLAKTPAAAGVRGGRPPWPQREERPDFHPSLRLSAFTGPWEWLGGDFVPVHVRVATKH